MPGENGSKVLKLPLSDRSFVRRRLGAEAKGLLARYERGVCTLGAGESKEVAIVEFSFVVVADTDGAGEAHCAEFASSCW